MRKSLKHFKLLLAMDEVLGILLEARCMIVQLSISPLLQGFQPFEACKKPCRMEDPWGLDGMAFPGEVAMEWCWFGPWMLLGNIFFVVFPCFEQFLSNRIFMK